MGGYCTVVLSGHRCGSSAVAGALHKMGVPMGRHLMGRSPANPGGHFEDQEFVGLHKRMLPDWRNPVVDLGVVTTEYMALLEKRGKLPSWGVKDPRMAFIFPLFRAFYHGKIRIVRMCRATEASAASMEARARQANNDRLNVGGRGLEIAAAYETAIRAILANWHGPALFVQYNRLVDRPRETVAMIAEFAGVEPTDEAINFINPDLRHFP
ncbi:MAG TPA: hypothetical protein VM537_31020 [Anaerolineae bacterium]|nr:hypothetical protein [Anaerolineae bacterium]